MRQHCSTRARTAVCITALAFLALLPVTGSATTWPVELKTSGGTVVVYQPELESFGGDTLTARAAISITPKGKKDPVFGAVWIWARLETDVDTREARLTEVKVRNARFPEASTEQMTKLKALIESELPKSELDLTIDQLLTALKVVEGRRSVTAELKNDPPKILLRTTPASLVLIDGEPKLQAIDGSDLSRIVNTPYFIVKEPKSGQFFLKSGSLWYTAAGVMGPWKVTASPPASVTALAAKAVEGQPADTVKADPSKAPEIVVVTEPTEMICTDGEPAYASIDSTELLYVSNTESEVFKDITTQANYYLVSGRWYTAPSLSGPWKYVAADQLPADFARIPNNSPKADILANVAGTPEAEDAVLEAQIPQTAKVNRATATTSVEYDGQPKFDRIEGTEVLYGTNASKTVLKVKDLYYCVDSGVWYQSSAATGPWAVCVSVPSDIYSIPPSSPAHNVTYVYVYDSTPEVVYVGYTPGYVGCYVYGPTVVYGTGYYYAPWYGTVYYPRPVTYGFGFHYNPWTGWSMGFSVGVAGPYGHVSFSVWGGGYGYWGPAAYRPPYYYRPYSTPYGYRPPGYGPGYGPGGAYRPGYPASGGSGAYKPPTGGRGGNIYGQNPHVSTRPSAPGSSGSGARPSQLPSTGARPSTGTKPSTGTRPSTGARPSTRENNVYSDKSGNVYRKTDKGWEGRGQNGWSGSSPSSRPSTGTQDLNRQHQARSQGAQRSQNYQRQASPQSRSSSAPRGGGGGGRRR